MGLAFGDSLLVRKLVTGQVYAIIYSVEILK